MDWYALVEADEATRQDEEDTISVAVSDTLSVDSTQTLNTRLDNMNIEIKSNDSNVEEDEDEGEDGVNVIIGAMQPQFDVSQEVRELIKNNKVGALYIIACLYINGRHQILVLNDGQHISPELAECIWKRPLLYRESLFPNADIYNEELSSGGGGSGEKVAVFSVWFQKQQSRGRTSKPMPTFLKPNNVATVSVPPVAFLPAYHYTDFAAAIVQNNRIIDYAIHGVRSNISEMMIRHQPKRVYYHGLGSNALTVFLNYQYQPFYKALEGRLEPVNFISNSPDLQRHYLSYCERSNSMCAFCQLLNHVFILVKQPPQNLQKFQEERIAVRKRRVCKQPKQRARSYNGPFKLHSARNMLMCMATMKER